MKKTLAILLALACIFALAACTSKPAEPSPAAPSIDIGGLIPLEADAPPDNPPAPENDFDYIRAKGKLVIGITEYEPMNYYDETGALVGFDTEFAQAVCAKLGVTPEFVVINWDTKEIELKSRGIDCIWNGLTVTEDRRANMAFSDSYLCNEQVVVVRAADAAKYTDKASFAGLSVVAEAESAGEAAVRADLTDAAYTPVAAQTSALLEVKAGTAAAAVIDYTMARAMTGEGTDYADLAILAIPLTNEEYAVGLRLGSEAVAEINAAIAALTADGTMGALAAKYDVTDLLIQ
jgi:polar amino acid transport system substrate-binding protein